MKYLLVERDVHDSPALVNIDAISLITFMDTKCKITTTSGDSIEFTTPGDIESISAEKLKDQQAIFLLNLEGLIRTKIGKGLNDFCITVSDVMHYR